MSQSGPYLLGVVADFERAVVRPVVRDVAVHREDQIEVSLVHQSEPADVLQHGADLLPDLDTGWRTEARPLQRTETLTCVVSLPLAAATRAATSAKSRLAS